MGTPDGAKRATAFAAIGIAGDDALRGLTDAYDNVDRRTLAAYLQATGYARSVVNGVLGSWGLPGL